MTANEVGDALQELTLHDHACLLYETPDEQFAAAAPFFKRALQSHAYCGYIADENSCQTVIERLGQHGIPVSEEMERGRLALLTKRETYFRDGLFAPDKMIAFVRAAVHEAQSKFFTGARFTGEMTWHLGSHVTAHELLVYEAKLNYLIREEPVAGICQYNLNRFPPRVLLGILETHPMVIYKRTLTMNRYYVPPEEYLAEQRRIEFDYHLRDIVEGERTTRALRSALAHLEQSRGKLPRIH